MRGPGGGRQSSRAMREGRVTVRHVSCAHRIGRAGRERSTAPATPARYARGSLPSAGAGACRVTAVTREHVRQRHHRVRQRHDRGHHIAARQRAIGRPTGRATPRAAGSTALAPHRLLPLGPPGTERCTRARAVTGAGAGNDGRAGVAPARSSQNHKVGPSRPGGLLVGPFPSSPAPGDGCSRRGSAAGLGGVRVFEAYLHARRRPVVGRTRSV